MTKIKIEYEKEYISKEEIEKLNLNREYVDIEEGALNSKQPQMSLIPTVILLIINSQNFWEGALANLFADGVAGLFKLGYDKYKNRPVKKIDSSYKVEILKPGLKFRISDEVEVVVIANNEITPIQMQNIFNTLAHFKKGRYIVTIDKDGRIKALTELEFAQLKYKQQENNKKD